MNKKRSVELSEDQLKYGNECLQILADKYDLSKIQIAKIIEDIGSFRDFYEWCNAGQFLMDFIYNSRN